MNHHNDGVIPNETSNHVTLTINGQTVSRDVTGGQLLVDFLRSELGLTGTKEACGVGVCGLCTVLLDGVIVSSCLTPVACVAGREVWTIEGITALTPAGDASVVATREPLTAGTPNAALMAEVQQAFVGCEGMQCGICTTGQVMSAYALLADNPNSGPDEIRHHMAGNLCRCTGYQSIMRSVHLAQERWSQHRACL